LIYHPDLSIQEIFQAIDAQRDVVIRNNNIKLGYFDFGIQSTELNEIIDQAQALDI
jgi:hypothetical protein